MSINHVSRYADLTEEQYAALGRAVVEWANVEFLLGILLGRLLATPDFLARTYTEPLTASRLQEAIAEAVKIHRERYRCRAVAKEDLDEVELLSRELEHLRVLRNKVAHLCWVRVDDQEIIGAGFPGGMPTPQKERRSQATFTNQELKALNAKSHHLVDRLEKLVAKLPALNEETIWARTQDEGHGT